MTKVLISEGPSSPCALSCPARKRVMSGEVSNVNDRSVSVWTDGATFPEGPGRYGTCKETPADYTILVVGKTGSGKSRLCNLILGEEGFKVGRGMSATTTTASSHDVVKGNIRIKVVDTPDITNLGLNDQQKGQEVYKWRQLTESNPSIVLLTVRCDIRYTPEEHAIYREIMALWPWLKKRLMVAFTFGDRQDVPLELELQTVCPELKSVLSDAGNEYVVCYKADDQMKGRLTSEVVNAIERRKRGPVVNRPLRRVCPIVGLVCFILLSVAFILSSYDYDDEVPQEVDYALGGAAFLVAVVGFLFATWLVIRRSARRILNV
ncbi:GTPase IMAP family member 4-like [Babylonia areolata]|uniref:GTPase IMAP family member 4-like n=1 Tax=Babylonia areolata TaxID=304850 RepID=UPI003FD34367